MSGRRVCLCFSTSLHLDLREYMTTTQTKNLSQRLYEQFKQNGFNFFAGVPCSFLAGIIRLLEEKEDYLSAVREDQAIGLASGAYLGSKLPVVLMQNSGLGVSVNALASLNLIYKIPLFMVISMRGFQIKDAPEHWIMGEVTTVLLEDLHIPYRFVDEEKLDENFQYLMDRMKTEKIPVALLSKKGLLG